MARMRHGPRFNGASYYPPAGSHLGSSARRRKTPPQEESDAADKGWTREETRIFLEHAKRPEWGRGTIKFWSPLRDKVLVYFPEAGYRKFYFPHPDLTLQADVG